jgi:hypothetical protein
LLELNYLPSVEPANGVISLLVWGRIGHEVACGQGVIELGIIGLR